MTDVTSGQVTRVELLNQGSHLIATAPAGTTTLQVDSVAAFAADGGTIDLDGTRISYTSRDPDASTITLAAPLAAEGEAGLPVWLVLNNDISVEYWATVNLDEPDAEPIEARLTTSMTDHLPEGDYSTPAPVELQLIGEVWHVMRDAPGRASVRYTVDEDGVVTSRYDTQGGQATHIGEFGTAPYGQVGIFARSQEFSYAAGKVIWPVLQFNVGTTRDQPSIQADTGNEASLRLFSGANTNQREASVMIENGQIRMGVEKDPDGSQYGAQMILGRDLMQYRTDYMIGPANKAGLLECSWITETYFSGFRNNTQGNLEGMQVLMGSTVKILTAGPDVQITNQAGDAWRAVSASAFNVSSDRASKDDITPPTREGLAVVRDAPVYEWTYRDDETCTRRFGPLAEDLPSDVKTRVSASADSPGAGQEVVNIAAQVGVLWQAVQELDAEVRALRAELANR